MKNFVCLQSLAAVCFAAITSTGYAQTNAVQLFSPVDVRTSTAGTGYGNEAVFNTTILNLTCTQQPIQAKISSTSDGTGNVLVDNFITFGTGNWTPTDICSNGTVENGNQQNCFTGNYSGQAHNGGLNGKDPDLYVTTGGVPPIDVSSRLQGGAVQATIGLVDTGGYLAGSTLYLVTNCTSNGVSGPGKVTGNPIPQNNATDAQLSQNFAFNPAAGQQVQFTYNLIQAQNAGTLTIANGTIPTTTDTPLDPSTFSTKYLAGTSFATANCLLHSGELYSGAPACKLYTLTCQVGTNPSQAGALCPSSLDRNEIFQENFDGPDFALPDIQANGLTFHQGVALLEAIDDWQGGSCVFDADANLGTTLCPQNLLTTFSGPGAYESGGRGTHPNSAFISVAPVPEDLTTVSVPGQHPPNYWINNPNPKLDFVSTPPSVPGNSNFVPSPIQSLTYGVSDPSSVPQPGPPVSTDTTILNPASCPLPASPRTPAAAVFTPPAQGLSLADGEYLVHYFAQDCAGTEELKFTKSGGSWSTSYYTFPIYVDTVAPHVASGPTLSPAPSTNGGVPNSYLIGQKVTASYRCTDDRSGIVTCGAYTYAPGTTLDTGNLTSTIDTSKTGPGTFTVAAVDAAGNTTTNSVNYTVDGPPVNLFILKVAAPQVQQNAQLTYVITASNLSKQAASSVVITDSLPAGVTFVKASAQQLVCSNGRCSNAAGCTFANNTVSCTAPSLTFITPILAEIVVKVQAPVGTKIKNTASVSSANGSGSTQSTATTTVVKSW